MFFVIQYVLSLLVGEAPGYYSVIFSVALVVFAYGQGVVSKLLCGEGLNKIAENSFEFYMFHELMLRVFRKVFGNIELSYLLKCTVIAIPALVCTVGLVIAYKRIRLYANKKGYLKLFI